MEHVLNGRLMRSAGTDLIDNGLRNLILSIATSLSPSMRSFLESASVDAIYECLSSSLFFILKSG